MQFELNNTPSPQVETACLVVGIFADHALPAAAEQINAASDGLLQSLIDSEDISTRIGKITLLHQPTGIAAQRLLLVGCGKYRQFDAFALQKVSKAVGKYLCSHPINDAHITLAELPVDDCSEHWRLRHAATYVAQENYLYTATKKAKKNQPKPLQRASFSGQDETALKFASGINQGVFRARELGNLPPNICTPIYLAEQAQAITDQYDKVSLEVLDAEAMNKLGMHSLLAVGQGSRNPPQLVILKYSGAASDQAPIVLVGKGITFDTGGISLKPGEHMDQMKYDMCGAAAVIGAFEACAAIGLAINLITVVPAAENMPDGNAYRPGDVLTSMSGQTIEVLNTDAEGRLILCDALTYSQQFEPAAIVDVATLTGACVVALGHHASGLMTPSDKLAKRLVKAGNKVLDRAWRLPLWDDYQKQLDTPFADMKNVGGRSAGAITAGCFLSRFAEDQTWAHLDIAGSAWEWGTQKGATGRPVALLTQYLIDQADD